MNSSRHGRAALLEPKLHGPPGHAETTIENRCSLLKATPIGQDLIFASAPSAPAFVSLCELGWADQPLEKARDDFDRDTTAESQTCQFVQRMAVSFERSQVVSFAAGDAVGQCEPWCRGHVRPRTYKVLDWAQVCSRQGLRGLSMRLRRFRRDD